MLLYQFLGVLLLATWVSSQSAQPLPESEIRFGYGISYTYTGKMLHGLNRYHFIVGMKIPDLRMSDYYTPTELDRNFCEQWQGAESLKTLYYTCKNVWPAYTAATEKILDNRNRVFEIMEDEVSAVIPNFRLKKMGGPRLVSTSYPTRKKRFISEVLGLGIQAVSAYFQHRKQTKIQKGLRKLALRTDWIETRIEAMEDDMVSIASTTLKELEYLQRELKYQGMRIRELSGQVKRLEIEVLRDKERIADNSNSVTFLGAVISVLLADLSRYNILYERAIAELDHFLDAMDALSTNRLSHAVVQPHVLKEMIEHVKTELIEKHPNYELVLKEVHEYYNLPVSTFFYINDTLLVHIPVYIKPRLQEALYLYGINSLPVPYHMNPKVMDEDESENAYTQVKPSTEILAMSSDTYINLEHRQLKQCMKYNDVYFCEQMYLMKHNSEHTCESAIYHRQSSELIKEKCDIQYYPYLDPEPAILDAGDHLLLGNLPLPWSYMCSHEDQIPNPITGSKYAIIKKSDLCQCSLSAGTWYLQENIVYCTGELDTRLTLYYTLNMAAIIYQGVQKLEEEQVTDITLYKHPDTWDPEQPEVIWMEDEDNQIMERDINSAPYERVVNNVHERKYLSKQDMVFSLTESESWMSGEYDWLTVIAIGSLLAIVILPLLLLAGLKILQLMAQFGKLDGTVGTILGVLGLADNGAQPVQATSTHHTCLTKTELTLLILQILGFVVTLYIFYKLVKKILIWYNPNNLTPMQPRLSLLTILTMDKTDIYLQLINSASSCTFDLFLGSYFGNPEDLAVEGSLESNKIILDKHCWYDYLDVYWGNCTLSLRDLELQMPVAFPVPLPCKFLVRKLTRMKGTHFRLIAHNKAGGKTCRLTEMLPLHEPMLLQVVQEDAQGAQDLDDDASTECLDPRD